MMIKKFWSVFALTLVLSAAAFGMKCKSYANKNPNNPGSGWIVRNGAFGTETLLYCQAPGNPGDRAKCTDAD